MTILAPKKMKVAEGDTRITIPRSNGVRQGSLDSPVLFSSLVNDKLEDLLAATVGEDTVALPITEEIFMDDTYLWHYHLESMFEMQERLHTEWPQLPLPEAITGLL